MNKDQIRYALAKQLATAHTLGSDYGAVELDDEMKRAIQAALSPLLEGRLFDSVPSVGTVAAARIAAKGWWNQLDTEASQEDSIEWRDRKFLEHDEGQDRGQVDQRRAIFNREYRGALDSLAEGGSNGR